jgi:hypothetical protein
MVVIFEEDDGLVFWVILDFCALAVVDLGSRPVVRNDLQSPRNFLVSGSLKNPRAPFYYISNSIFSTPSVF